MPSADRRNDRALTAFGVSPEAAARAATRRAPRRLTQRV